MYPCLPWPSRKNNQLPPVIDRPFPFHFPTPFSRILLPSSNWSDKIHFIMRLSFTPVVVKDFLSVASCLIPKLFVFEQSAPFPFLFLSYLVLRLPLEWGRLHLRRPFFSRSHASSLFSLLSGMISLFPSFERGFLIRMTHLSPFLLSCDSIFFLMEATLLC